MRPSAGLPEPDRPRRRARTILTAVSAVAGELTGPKLRYYRRVSARVFAPWLAVAVIAITSSVARADPTEQERIAAESLFREGQEAARSGRTEEACSKFEQSHRLDPQLGALLHLATCHEQLGRTATAWLEFTDAADMAARAGARDREKIARQRAADLERRLPRLTIEASSTAGLEVLLDGKPLRPETLGTALPLDPGTHVLQAQAPGHRSWSTQIRIEPRATTSSVRVPSLEPEAAPPAPAARPAPARPAVPPDTSSQDRRIAGWIVLGLGVVGLGVAGVTTGILAANDAHIEDECPGNVCSEDGLETADSSRSLFPVNAAGFVVGALGVGIGTLLIVTSGSNAPKSTGIRARVTADGATLGIHRRF